jgi:predicted nucleic acid-binding Zn ribbon protein
MTCPVCKCKEARRSRRQNLADNLLSIVGIYPWRCTKCETRFYARVRSLSDSLHAHCPICGNPDLKRIAAEHVDSTFGFVWRRLPIPAYRCEPCRYKYFSIRPLRHLEEEPEPAGTTAVACQPKEEELEPAETNGLPSGQTGEELEPAETTADERDLSPKLTADNQ